MQSVKGLSSENEVRGPLCRRSKTPRALHVAPEAATCIRTVVVTPGSPAPMIWPVAQRQQQETTTAAPIRRSGPLAE